MSIPNDTRFDDLKAAARKLGGEDAKGQLSRIELAMKVLDAAIDGVIDPYAKLAKGEDSPVTVIYLTYIAASAAKLDGVESDRKPAVKQGAAKLNTFAKLGATRTFDPKAVLANARRVMASAGVSPGLENLVKFNTAQNQSATPLDDGAILALFAPKERAPRETVEADPAPETGPAMNPEVVSLTRALEDLRKAPTSPEVVTAIAMISQRIEKIASEASDMIRAQREADAEAFAESERARAAEIADLKDRAQSAHDANNNAFINGVKVGENNAAIRQAQVAEQAKQRGGAARVMRSTVNDFVAAARAASPEVAPVQPNDSLAALAAEFDDAPKFDDAPSFI